MTNALPSDPDSGPASATLNCPHCQYTITYYDVKGSSFYGCPNCQTYFKYELESFPRRLTQFNDATRAILQVGSEGYLSGQMHRVVGFMHRQEKGTNYDWREYVLLKVDGTYAQLAEYQGHWTYIVPVKNKYKEYNTSGKAFYVDTPERQYRLYNRYQPETLVAVGEFDWNVLDDDKLSVSEYINPPYLLVGERNNSLVDWYEGVYKTPAEIATAFGMTTAELPIPQGTGAIQPPYNNETWTSLIAFTGIALVVLLSIQLVFMVVKPRQVVLSTSYTAVRELGTATNQFKPVITRSFTIEGPAAIEIDLNAEIDNQWVELPISLVNETTGQSYELTKVLEYYHGYEGGESWSEGGKTDDAELSRIPSGRYHVNLYPISEITSNINGTVKVVQNPTIFSNVLILVGLLAIYPIYLSIRRMVMESSRWQNSDFADDN